MRKPKSPPEPFLHVTISSNDTELSYIAKDKITKALQADFPNMEYRVTDKFGENARIKIEGLSSSAVGVDKDDTVYDMVKRHSPHLFDTKVVIAVDLAGAEATKPTQQNHNDRLKEMVGMMSSAFGNIFDDGPTASLDPDSIEVFKF